MSVSWTQTEHYRVPPDGRFELDSCDPGFHGELLDKHSAAVFLERGVQRLSELQEVLYADGRWGLLVVFQATDAAGKDSTIKHVMSGVNPQGVKVHSFKVPSTEESRHHWLWRYGLRVPMRGMIGIFNRSHYEEVLVVKVHDLVQQARMPRELVTKDVWKERYEDINAFEQHLTRNGIRVVKFFLHVSKDEQRKRFLERLEEEDKHWKFSLADLAERERWDDYQKAFQRMLRETSTTDAPWYCVPMDRKWFGRLVVTHVLCEELERMRLSHPEPDEEQHAALRAARERLRGE